MSLRTFRAEFERQANELGNTVRALELIAEAANDPRFQGLEAKLAYGARALFSRIPRSRLRDDIFFKVCTAAAVDPTVVQFAPEPDPSNLHTNRILLPLLERTRSRQGLVREFWIELATPYDHRATFPLQTQDSFRWAVTNACERAAEDLDRAGILPLYKVPDDYVFRLEERPGGGNPAIHEESAWLAAYLSYFSLLAGLPVPRCIAASGSIGLSGRPSSLEGLPTKLRACERERPDLDQLIVLTATPLGGLGPRTQVVHTAIEAAALVWGADWLDRARPPSPSFHAALDRATYAYLHEHDLPDALARFQILGRYLEIEPPLSERFRLICDWRLASCFTHLRQPERAQVLFDRWIGRAEDLLERRVIDSENLADLLASYGVHLRHLGHLTQAIAMLSRGLMLAERYYCPLPSVTRLKTVLGLALGDAADFASAEQHLLDAHRQAEIEPKAKTCIHLAQLYIAWGRLDRARHFISEAGDLCERIPSPHCRSVTRQFGQLCESRLQSAMSIVQPLCERRAESTAGI